MEIEYRSISIVQSESRHTGNSEIHVPNMPLVCAVCGSPWVLVRPEADAGFDSRTQRVLDALMKRGLHTYLSIAGQLWVCRQSFQHLSENA